MIELTRAIRARATRIPRARRIFSEFALIPQRCFGKPVLAASYLGFADFGPARTESQESYPGPEKADIQAVMASRTLIEAKAVINERIAESGVL